MLHESDGMRTRRRHDTGNPRAERLPDTTARLVTFTVTTATRSGRAKTTLMRVLTTLLDHRAYPAAEIAVLCQRAASVDLVILGTVDALGEPSVVELARALVATGTPLIAVALRAPWDAVAYPEVGTVLATYGIQTPSLTALAAAIWGDASITGLLPVSLSPAPR